MKTSLLILFVGLFSFAFNEVKVTEYQVDNQESKITWVGRKVTGEHSGTIDISNGKLIWNGDQLSGGAFELDMNSIANTDITDAEYNQQLVDHLKNDDFFSTEKYPTAKFVITNVKQLSKNQVEIKGNLTIKDISKEIQFPATIQEKGGQLQAKAKIMVDRTLYDIRYGSGSFFDNLGDKAIDNEFELNVDLVAKK